MSVTPTKDHYKFNQPELLIPSPAFIKKSKQAFRALVVFIALYVVITLTFLSLFIAVYYYFIFQSRGGFLSLLLGVVVWIISLLFASFAIRALFAKIQEGKTNRIEITKSDQPQLFDLIEEVARETNINLPSRIYLSSGVNAMVFHNSSFLNFFIPVRRELEIGIGLLQTINKTELKGVLAHEFGHFSQSGLQAGNYLYTVNRIVFGSLYGQDSWDRELNSRAEKGGFFGMISYAIIMFNHRLKKILAWFYDITMVKYMELSREMEFHADLVAASIAGRNNFSSALRKIEFSQFAFDFTVNTLNGWVGQQRKSENLFDNHLDTIQFLAAINKIKYNEKGLEITDEDVTRSVVKSQINVLNQWASHPSLAQREQNISRVNFIIEPDTSSASSLLQNSLLLFEKLTTLAYEDVPKKDELNSGTRNEYRDYMQSQMNRFKLNARYGEFFEDRYLRVENLDDAVVDQQGKSFEELFSADKSEYIKRAKINKMDMMLVEQIKEKKVPFRVFEYQEKKYTNKNCSTVLIELQIFADNAEIEIRNMDRAAIGYFLDRAKRANREEELTQLFNHLVQLEQISKKADEVIQKLFDFHQKINSKPQWTAEEVTDLHSEIRNLEKILRQVLPEGIENEIIPHFTLHEQIEFMNKNLRRDDLITSGLFDHQMLAEITDFIQMTHYAVGNSCGLARKALTDFGIEISE